MNSRLQLNRPTLYLDRNLGSKLVPAILRSKNIPHEIHDNNLASDAPDEDWILLCSNKNWIAITKDTRLKYNHYIKNAILKSTVAIFTLTAKNHTGEQLGNLIAANYDQIIKFTIKTERPFIATLSNKGFISLIRF